MLKQPGDASDAEAEPVAPRHESGGDWFAIGAAVLVIVPLLAIFVYLLIKGAGSVESGPS